MNHSIADSPSFLSKILKKKSSSNRPLYTADMTPAVVPWKKQFQNASKAYSSKKPKTYNIREPQLVSTSNSAITTASLLSDSAIIIPTSSCSSPLTSQTHGGHRKQSPLTTESLIRFMDQDLKKQQQTPPSVPMTMSKPITHTPRIQSTVVKRNSHRHHHHHHAIEPLRKKSIDQQPLPYVLSLDNDEQDRMVSQHYLLRTAFGSDFSSPIKSQLQNGIVVLDVGCGPGTWTMEMSTAFPKSTFIGIDQNAFYPNDIKPRNCHFRTCGSLMVTRDSQTISLPFPDNSIDYIYQRDMNWAFTEQTWEPLLQEFQRILKHGGWIECMEPKLETQNPSKKEREINEKLLNGLHNRRQDIKAVDRLPAILANHGFAKVLNKSKQFPLGWGNPHSNNNSIIEEDENQQETQPQLDCSEFARAMSSQYICLLQSLKPWLSKVMNLNPEKYDDFIYNLPAEWKRAETFVEWSCITAQKP